MPQSTSGNGSVFSFMKMLKHRPDDYVASGVEGSPWLTRSISSSLQQPLSNSSCRYFGLISGMCVFLLLLVWPRMVAVKLASRQKGLLLPSADRPASTWLLKGLAPGGADGVCSDIKPAVGEVEKFISFGQRAASIDHHAVVEVNSRRGKGEITTCAAS
jgi:hypothetical protein